MNNIEDLKVKLYKTRSSEISLEQFKIWLSANIGSYNGFLSKGELLKLKHGDKSQTMYTGKAILPSCPLCTSIFEQKSFSDRAEHLACANAVDQALHSGVLKRLRKPDWYNPAHSEAGADAYFICNSCESLWNLVEPEKQYGGLWERIA